MEPRHRLFNPVQRVLLFKRVPFLAGLGTPELSLLAKNSWLRHHKEGAPLLAKGVVPHRFHVIVKGSAGDAGPEQTIGFLNVLARRSPRADVLATSAALTLEIDADDLRNMLEDHFPLLRHFIRELARAVLDEERPRRDGLTRSPAIALGLGPSQQLDLAETLVLLRRAARLRQWPLDTLVEAAGKMSEQTIPAGEILWRDGDPARRMEVIVTGSVECRAADTTFLAGSGFVLGGIETLAARPRWYHARTETDVRTLRLPAAYALDLLEDHFEIADDVLCLFASALMNSDAGRRLNGEAAPRRVDARAQARPVSSPAPPLP